MNLDGFYKQGLTVDDVVGILTLQASPKWSPTLSRTAKFSLMAKFCAKIASSQFCICNFHSKTLVPQQIFRNWIAGCRNSNNWHCIPQISFCNGLLVSRLRDAGWKLPKVAPLQLPLRNSLNYHIFAALTPTIYLLLVRTSQIYVDLLNFSQLPLWDFSGPSDLYLRTQSPSFILCKICSWQKIYGLRRLIMEMINPAYNHSDSIA